MSQYIRKGDINDEKEMEQESHGILSSILIELFDHDYDDKEVCSDSSNLSQLLFYFVKLCNNGGVKLPKSTIEYVLKQCKNDKCKEMLNGYIDQKYHNKK